MMNPVTMSDTFGKGINRFLHCVQLLLDKTHSDVGIFALLVDPFPLRLQVLDAPLKNGDLGVQTDMRSLGLEEVLIGNNYHWG